MNHIYSIKWTQPYRGWYECPTSELERRLAASDLSEANTVIERIMKL